jgi:hypothetical protein
MEHIYARINNMLCGTIRRCVYVCARAGFQLRNKAKVRSLYIGLKFQTTQNSRIYSKRAIKLLTGGIRAPFERSQDFTFNHAGLDHKP